MELKELREQAGKFLAQAEIALEEGKLEESTRFMDEYTQTKQKAQMSEQIASRMEALKGEINIPTNQVPVASKDVEQYDASDTTAKTKGNYKPSTWVKGLPAHAQPLWVQEQMGDNLKEIAQVQTDVFTKWMRAPSDDMFWKTATPDEIKAMQEDKILCPIS